MFQHVCMLGILYVNLYTVASLLFFIPSNAKYTCFSIVFVYILLDFLLSVFFASHNEKEENLKNSFI